MYSNYSNHQYWTKLNHERTYNAYGYHHYPNLILLIVSTLLVDEKYGDEQVHIWRRSYDVLPPVIEDDSEYSQAHDRRYANLDPHIVPKAENLKVTLDRVMPFWEDHIAPDLLSGKNVIIAAHGNSLRALTKYIENISDEDIMDLEMKTGEPVVYTFDEQLNVVNKEKLDD